MALSKWSHSELFHALLREASEELPAGIRSENVVTVESNDLYGYFPLDAPPMEISDQLQCLFSATVEETDGSYIIEIPKREVQLGALASSETYRIAVLSGNADQKSSINNTKTVESSAQPPVEEGETRTVEI
jgi:hypothetical protein